MRSVGEKPEVSLSPQFNQMVCFIFSHMLIFHPGCRSLLPQTVFISDVLIKFLGPDANQSPFTIYKLLLGPIWYSDVN